MRTLLAYLLLVVFSILILAGSFFIFICPETAAAYRLSGAGPTQSNYVPLFLVIAAVLMAFAYGGSYLLIKFRANTYLTQKIGYGKIVTLGFVLQLVMGLLFCIALLGGLQGSSAGNIVVILLLCLPIIVRKLIQLTARDRSYDNFLKETPQDQ